MMLAGSRRKWLSALLVGGLIVLLALGLWLRWSYATTSSLHVDEFTTLWAATRLQELGAPWMPSGVLYTRGLLASYVEALFLSALGGGVLAGRSPSILFGLLTLLVTFAVGRRMWGAAVSWLAVVGLTLLPEAIVWSGRARFYSQLQLFTLLTLWAAYEAIVAPPSTPANKRVSLRLSPRSAHILFAAFFILALFTQEQMALLYPAILLAGLLWRGWRWLLRPPAMPAHLVCVASLALRFAIELLGQPGSFETIQAQRPYVGIVLDVVGAWRVYSPLLTAPERLPWTLGGALAVIVGLVRLWRTRRLLDLRAFHQATLFFALQLAFVLAAVFLVVGTSWREARYLFFVQPVWLLLGAAGMVWVVEHLTQRISLRIAAYAVLSLMLAAMLWRPAQFALTQQVEGYDRVLAWLGAERQSDDVVLSPQPPACAMMLGACNYYAVQRGYEEFVIEKDGALVDRWTGAHLLDNQEQLEAVVRGNQRVWFVSDAFRLATRYDGDFLRTLIEQFDVAMEEHGVMALLAQGWRAQPVMLAAAEFTPPPTFGPLRLTRWEAGAAQPGANLPVTLFWSGAAPISEQINTTVRAVAADGRILAQEDGPPARGIIPTTLFFDTPLPDPKLLTLPADLPPGRYRLETTAYRLADDAALGDLLPLDWFVIGEPPAAPQRPMGASWGNGLQLVGSDQLPAALTPGEMLDLRLVWSTSAPLRQDLHVFVHLLGPDGNVIGQNDRAPQGGFFPTWGWEVGERVDDYYSLELPENLPVGDYRLVVGWYEPASGERVQLMDGGDGFELMQWSVAE
jgi:hypothetical protein